MLLTFLAVDATARVRPNVLMIMTDDQSAEGTMAVMPETRRLIGRRGTTFLEAHATTPSCCPSRASFFTGLYAHNHHVTANTLPHRLNQRRTVQRALQRRGYRTAIFGKYLNSWPVEDDPPFFDQWAITAGEFTDGDWNTNGRVRRDVDRYNADFISDRAVGFIQGAERRDDQPWLAWLTPSAPHWPSTPARRHRDASLPRWPRTPALAEDDTSDKPDFLDAARGFPDQIATVRDDGRRGLMAVDEMVARVVRALRRKRELADTLLMFTSDNGLLLGQHGGLAGKDLPYRSSTRIPLLMRWDRRVPAGLQRRQLTSNVDVGTTILRAAGSKWRTDGRSLLSSPRPRPLFLEHYGARNSRGELVLPAWHALLTRRFRYAEYRDPDDSVIYREYYDLRSDPWELENRADELSPERRATLSDRVNDYSTCKGRSCP